MTTRTYRVDGMTCAHCVHAVSEELAKLDGVEAFDVSLDTKLVTVSGAEISDEQVFAAVDEAGYEAVAVS